MNPETSLPKRLGRRSVQTPENAKIICDALARGMPYVHACAVANISFQTFSVWRDRDADFREAIAEAIALGVEKRLKVIEKAADLGEWRAASWLLEHCQPEHFAKTRIELTGANGAPVTIGHVIILPPKDAMPVEIAAVEVTSDEN